MSRRPMGKERRSRWGSRGLSIVAVLILSGLAALAVTGLMELSSIQMLNLKRRTGMKRGWDQTSMATELANELVFRGYVAGYPIPPASSPDMSWVCYYPNSAPCPATLAANAPALSWSFVPGFPVSNNLTPVAQMKISVCDTNAMKITDLAGSFSATPFLNTNCPRTQVTLVINDSVNASYVEFMSYAGLPTPTPTTKPTSH